MEVGTFEVAPRQHTYVQDVCTVPYRKDRTCYHRAIWVEQWCACPSLSVSVFPLSVFVPTNSASGQMANNSCEHLVRAAHPLANMKRNKRSHHMKHTDAPSRHAPHRSKDTRQGAVFLQCAVCPSSSLPCNQVARPTPGKSSRAGSRGWSGLTQSAQSCS